MNIPSGRSILILEDEPLIALDLESTLADAGFHDLVIRTSCHDASIWLSHNTPSMAILDIHLKDGSCDHVAQVLVDRHVPFVVCSATHREDIKDVFLFGQFLSKPCQPHHLIDGVHQALSNQEWSQANG